LGTICAPLPCGNTSLSISVVQVCYYINYSCTPVLLLSAQTLTTFSVISYFRNKFLTTSAMFSDVFPFTDYEYNLNFTCFI
jgi:hypothetical protein